MKKIIIVLLVAMVPLLTIAQKRSKKDKTTTKSNIEYMMIKGIEFPVNNEAKRPGDVREMALGSIHSEDIRLIVAFDYGDVRNEEAREMRDNSKRFRTMISAVNAASEKGWEFVNSNVLLEDKMKTHYYYMKRRK